MASKTCCRRSARRRAGARMRATTRSSRDSGSVEGACSAGVAFAVAFARFRSGGIEEADLAVRLRVGFAVSAAVVRFALARGLGLFPARADRVRRFGRFERGKQLL